MSDKLKMAFIQSVDYDHWPVGGTLTYVRNIIPFFADKFELDIWGVILKGEKDFSITLDNHSYSIKRYATVKEKKIIPNFLRTFFGMLKNAKKFKNYDILFVHSGLELIAIKMILKKKTPYVAFVQHGLSYLTTTNKYVKYYYTITANFAYKYANIVFVVSDNDTVKDFLKQRIDLQSKIRTVGSPINYQIIHEQYSVTDKMKNGIKFLYTGRLSMEKQIDKTIESFNLFCTNENITATLTLIGDGPIRKDLEKKVEQLNMRDKIIFLGKMEYEQLQKELINYDIFLMSSMGEGMSLSTLEAMSAGLPVVCYNVAGMKNLVNDTNGFCVEYNNIEAFATAMGKCIKYYSTLSQGACNTAKRYDKQEVSNYFINNIFDNYYKYKKKSQ